MINWFPGHMAKATKQLQNIKVIELMIEVVDARCMQSSSNPLLVKLINKPKLTIALKADLADLTKIKANEDLLIGSIKNRNFRQEIIKKLYQIFHQKIISLKSQGLVQPHFHLMIVGLPNIGKSSLINFLAQKQKTKIENRPGVTRNQQLVRIDDYFYIYDTPGIFVKKVNSLEEGYKLALVGTIAKHVIPINDVCEWAFKYLLNHYSQKLFHHYNMDPNIMDYTAFIHQLCEQYHFLNTNQQYDVNRATQWFYDQLINGKIMPVNYENQ